MVSLCDLFKVRDTVSIDRGGMIPFCKIADGHFRLLMGKKRRTGKYSDFGGGIKKYESFVQGTQREFTEEINGVLELDIETLLVKDDCIILAHRTKRADVPAYYVELLVPIVEDKSLVWKFGFGKNNEHWNIRWLDVIRDANGKMQFKHIDWHQFDGSVKPHILAILDILERL